MLRTLLNGTAMQFILPRAAGEDAVRIEFSGRDAC
jgi:hypothetical protein